MEQDHDDDENSFEKVETLSSNLNEDSPIFWYYRRKRYRNRLLWFSFLLLFFGLAFIFLQNALAKFFFVPPDYSSSLARLEYLTRKSLIFEILGYTSVIFSTSFFVYIYLEYFNNRALDRQLSYLNDFDEDFEDVADGNEEASSSESNLSSFIDEDFDEMKGRLYSEVERLSKNANLNLAFGSVMTIGALFFLGIQIFTQSTNFHDATQLIAYYTPRISIVIFVEIFAFFFLRIYRANLFDIKYFNNELTNVELQIIATKIALKNESKVDIKVTIEKLLNTERNFKLKKGETTLEIEKERLENSNSKNVIDSLKELLKLKIG